MAAQSGRGWVLGAGLLLLGLLAGVILGKLWLSEAPVPSSGSTVRFSIQPPGEVEEIWAPAVAPDGSFLVYEGHGRDKSRLFIHRLDETAPRVLQGTEGAQMPFISPDGRWVGFRQGGTLKKVPVAGGDVLTICDVPGGFPGAAWRSDGKIVFPLSWLTGLWSVSAEGGEPQLLTEPDPDQDEKGHWWPRLLPDGRNALFTIWRAKAGLNDASVAVIDLETGIYRTLFPGADAQFLPPGHIVYYRAGAYHAVPFNLRTLEVSGESVRILDDVSDLEPAGDDHMPLIVASTGLLAYTTSQIYPEARLAWVAPDQAPEFLPFPSRRYFDLDLASDGRSLLTVSLEAGSHEIRLMDIERGTEQRLDLPGSNWSPRWDPSGGSFAFLSMRKGDFDIYLLDLAGGSPEKPLLTGDMDETVEAWTPDGKRVVFTTSQPDGSNAAKAYAIGESSEPEVIFANSDFLSNLNLSGDGRWILYTGSYSGQDEVYVRSFPEAGPIVRVSRKGGRSPRWSGDGKEIIFRRGDQIVAHSFRIEGKRFVPERERVVLEAPLQNQTGPMARPDRGRMLVLLRTAEPKPPQLRVVLNWNQEVGQKAPRP